MVGKTTADLVVIWELYCGYLVVLLGLYWDHIGDYIYIYI